jgi:hypothetical protein
MSGRAGAVRVGARGVWDAMAASLGERLDGRGDHSRTSASAGTVASSGQHPKVEVRLTNRLHARVLQAAEADG